MLKNLVLIAGGAGVTPCLQLIRCIIGAADDTTTPHLIYCTDTPEYASKKPTLSPNTDRFYLLLVNCSSKPNSTALRHRNDCTVFTLCAMYVLQVLLSC